MKASNPFYAYHIRLIHPDEKIIFWKEIELSTFSMVMQDFLMKEIRPVAYCLIPDRLEMVTKAARGLFLEELEENLCSIITIYDDFFGENSKNRKLMAETRWEIRRLENKNELRDLIGQIHRLPVENKLVKQMHQWEHSSFTDYFYDDPEIIEPELIGDIIQDTLKMLSKGKITASTIIETHKEEGLTALN